MELVEKFLNKFVDSLTETEKEYLKSILDNNISKNNTSVKNTIIDIGEEVVISHSLYGDIPFIVIGKDHDADNSVTLLTRDIIRLLPFDNMRKNTDIDFTKYINANNRYSNSDILRWMNSTTSVSEWYALSRFYMPIGTYHPMSYAEYFFTEDGLLRGFSDDIVDSMITVDKTTIIPIKYDDKYDSVDIVTNKVFLLSASEVGLGDNNTTSEGKIYEYFINSVNNVDLLLAYPSKYCLDNIDIDNTEILDSNISLKTNKPWYWWLRTPRLGTSFVTKCIAPSGLLNYDDACNHHTGLRFAICLPTDKYLELKEKEN